MIVIKSSALVLIEFQNEWLDENGKIHFLMKDNKVGLESAIANGRQVLTAARQTGMKIVHCGLKFQEGYLELGLAKFGLREHIPTFKTFLDSEKGSQFVDPFIPQRDEFVVQSRSGASGFAGSNLDIFLRNQKVTDLYLAGFALHICVESTMRHGHDLGYNIVILEDACAAFTINQQKHVFENVVHHFGRRMRSEEFVINITNNK